MRKQKTDKKLKMINVKVTRDKYYQVNICDSNLIGTRINETTVNEYFYGKKCSIKEALEHLRNATMINALGKKSVMLVKKIKGEICATEINGIPHAQYYTII